MAALNPARYTKVFGSGFVKDYAEFAVLRIGKDSWTRGELAKLGIVQTRACSILNGIAAKLKVQSLADLYHTTSPYSLAEFPCGVVTLYVLFAIFLDRDLEPDAWYKAGQQKALISFISLKHKELEARALLNRETKARERKARRGRHERDVKRIIGTTQRTGAPA